MSGNMYASAKTWNPFVGCRFACTYCRPSFQAQAKRQKQNCKTCYLYEPHEHPERLAKIPSAPIVFVCGSGDISFAAPEYRLAIARATADHALRRGLRGLEPLEYYFQSKRPACFASILDALPQSAVLVTTLETNRGAGYAEISQAPDPITRFKQFCDLRWPRKVLTLEPLLDFDVQPFADMIAHAEPLYVWLGLNSRPKQVQLPEPSPEKIHELVRILAGAGIEVRFKDLRGLDLSRATVKP